MKKMTLYGIFSFLILSIVVLSSSNTTNTKEETIERQNIELESRRVEVYELSKENEKLEKAVKFNKLIIEKQNTAYITLQRETKELIEAYGKREEQDEETEAEAESVDSFEEIIVEESQEESSEIPDTADLKEQPKINENSDLDKEPESKEEPVLNEEPKINKEPESDEEPVLNEEQNPTEDISGKRFSVEATAYIAFCDTGCSGITATGIDVRETIFYQGLRIVAVDPNVIPLYTKVRIHLNDGSSFDAMALDTGGAIKGNKIDILVSSYDEAVKFGRQQIEVTIIE